MDEHRDPETWAQDLEDAFSWRPMETGPHETCFDWGEPVPEDCGDSGPPCPDPDSCPVAPHEVEITVRFTGTRYGTDLAKLEATIRAAVEPMAKGEVELDSCWE